MKYLIVNRPEETPGGDHPSASAFGEALRELGYDVTMVLADRLPPDVGEYDAAHMWSANAPSWGYPAARTIKEAGTFLVITPNWWSRRKRLDYYGYHEQDVAPGYTPGVAQTLALADIWLTCTMSEAAECWKLVPFKAVYNAGHGYDASGAQPQPADDPPYVSCLARIEPHKNQVNLAMACRQLDIPLKLVGSAVNEPYAAQAEALGAELVGQLPHDEALDVLARSAVHALPSFSETPSLANMEAAALGVPGVMGNIGAEIEFFGAGGIYADPTDWRNIAAGIQVALKRKRMRWADLPTWRDVARKVDVVLQAMGVRE